MPGGGTRTFLEPDQYEASLGQAQIAAVIVPRGKFRARLIWAELYHLQVLRCEEDSSRIAYVQLAPEHYGRALSGRPFSLPTEGRTLQLSRHLAAGLRRQRARICRPRLAETKPKILSHSEVARAIEQGLIQTLVTCLTTASAVTYGYAKRRHAGIMVRFEEVLAEHLSRPLQMPELCALVAVSDRTLRSCCAEFLGMSPVQYVLLRRLEAVRRALRDANPRNANVAVIAHRFGFDELERFSETYQATFGETPSVTLQRLPGKRPPAP